MDEAVARWMPALSVVRDSPPKETGSGEAGENLQTINFSLRFADLLKLQGVTLTGDPIYSPAIDF